MTLMEISIHDPRRFASRDAAHGGVGPGPTAGRVSLFDVQVNGFAGIDFQDSGLTCEGLPESHPATFRAYQRRHFLKKITPCAFHGIRGESPDLDAECARYAGLLAEAPIDLVCMGIGENGHIAFNDPPVADFSDPQDAKVVELDKDCRRQQVNDGCFPDIGSVPGRAITLTCPALMRAAHAVCIVPEARKARAVRDAHVYLDRASASGLGNLLRPC